MSREEIDQINILQATLAGMRRSLQARRPHRWKRWSTATGCRPTCLCLARAIVGGDGIEPAISAGLDPGKVARDRYMLALHESHPQYGLTRTAGYPTLFHLDAP